MGTVRPEQDADNYTRKTVTAAHVHHLTPFPPRKLSATIRAFFAASNTSNTYFSLQSNPSAELSVVQSPVDHVDQRIKIDFRRRYGQLEEVIGGGTFGTVYVCRKKESPNGADTSFAVKENHKGSKEKQNEYHKRVKEEFCVANALQHHNIVKTLDLLENDKGTLYTVMELCSAGDLYSLVKNTSGLNVIVGDCYMKQTLLGLQHIHNSGYAHRDLKLENILLTPAGVVKIADFGNAEARASTAELDRFFTKRRCASPPYAAPEEYLKDEFDLIAADVWSLGVIYLVMRTARYFWGRAEHGHDKFFDDYISGRRSEGGFEGIESLENVSTIVLVEK